MAERGRPQHDFPTRKYAYHSAGIADFAAPIALESGRVFRFILGRDSAPVVLKPSELARDPFAQGILSVISELPLTTRTLIGQLEKQFPKPRSFVVADGGQIPWSEETDDLSREFRFVIAFSNAAQPEVLVSSATNLDSENSFLQVIAWDEDSGAFQFYDRRTGSWIWAGSSWDALLPDSRGRGPFDSHVNGALNMKELKQPWVHWNSEAARIQDTALAPNDPLRTEPLWISRKGADVFEVEVARPGIRRWNDSRFRHSSHNKILDHFVGFMRQVLDTTTVNLASSPISNARLATATTVPLPLTFFLNSEALLDEIGLDPDIQVPQTSAQVYRETLQRFEVAITDGNHRFPGETHFVFIIPEPAFEDLVVLQSLLALELFSPKFAASLLMVDFCNPVFSARRRSLLQYVSLTAGIQEKGNFVEEFETTVRASPASSIEGTPEHEFLSNWALAEDQWRQTFESRIERFFAVVVEKLKTTEGFSDVFKLAESRRREFRKRPLAEFRLTTPITNISEDAPFVEFTEGGFVRSKP